MTIKLYGSPLSPYTRAAAITALERHVAYQLEPIGPADLQDPDYIRKHPFRKLPALLVDNRRIYETAAIMRYIDSIATSGNSLQPADPIERATSDQWMSAANSYLYLHAFNNFAFMRTLAPAFDLPVDEERLQDSKAKTADYLDIVEDAVTNQELGKEGALHLGDVLTGAILMPLKAFDEGLELLKNHAKTDAWLNRLARRPSFQQTDAKPG